MTQPPAARAVAADLPRVSGLLCTLPRTGSWLLAEALHTCECAGQPEEYFRPDYLRWYLSEWGAAPDTTVTEFLLLARRYGTSDNGVFTAKVHWYQMAWLLRQLYPADGTMSERASLERLLPGVRFVHLVRHDRVGQALSWYRAIHTDEWFRVAGEPVPDVPEVDLQQVRWLEDLAAEHHAEWEMFFQRNGITPLQVCYEDLVADYDATVRRVLGFLDAGFPACQPVPRGRLRRQSDDTTRRWRDAYLASRDELRPRGPDVRWDKSANRFLEVGRAAVTR